jgi:pilus assembly protein CpaE
MLGLRTGRGITEALAQLDTLDAIAIDGYVARHESGLKLLAENIEDGLPKKLDAASFSRMLNLIKDRHQLVVVAANRWLDEGSIAAAMDSRYVLIVLGQSLSDVRNAVRLRNLLIDAYGIAESSIRIVINRYSPRALVRSDMIVTALGIGDAALIPDDALLVRKSIDSGTPLVDLDRDAGITRAYLTLQSQLFGTSLVPEPGPIQRILATLSGSNR